MSRRNGLRRLILLLACMAGTASAEEAPAYSPESARATSMPVLAESLLGKERATDVISADVPAERAGVMNTGQIILFPENDDEWIVSTSGLGTDDAAVFLTRRGIIIRH